MIHSESQKTNHILFQNLNDDDLFGIQRFYKTENMGKHEHYELCDVIDFPSKINLKSLKIFFKVVVINPNFSVYISKVTSYLLKDIFF